MQQLKVDSVNNVEGLAAMYLYHKQNTHQLAAMQSYISWLEPFQAALRNRNASQVPSQS